MVYRQTHRLSAKVEFSPEAEKLYLGAKNKSEFIRQAIEHYVHHVVAFKEDIQEIKQMLHEIKERGTVIHTSMPSQEMIVDLEDLPEVEISEEERERQLGIQHTLNSFLQFGGREDDD